MTAPAAAKETILIVDDQAVVRDVVRQALESHGYRLLVAASGAEALQMSEEYPGTIDLLITDVVMPRMSGPALAEALRTARPGLRVLFFSGSAAEDATRLGVLSKDTPFLQKPFASLTVLVDMVRNLLDKPA
jgi:CheY-like chemotaxis protein